MLARIPALGPRLVSLMSDRIRDNTRAQEQRQKLAALGKLSAGLAHELNNPAAAVRREAVRLNSLETARDASSAAAGALMLMTRARADIDAQLKPPQIR